MYDELVKELRSKAEFLNVSDMRRNAPGLNLRNSFAEEMLKAADAIEELSKLRWIPVTERLPEERFAVLVYTPSANNQYMAYLAGGKWYVWAPDSARRPWIEVITITHWMPLPEPPKEEK